MVNFSLEGKVALVTGASYGIGFALATAFARQGAKIVFNDIKQELVDKGLAAYKAEGIEAVQRALQHSSRDITLPYAYADLMQSDNTGVEAAKLELLAEMIADKVLRRLVQNNTNGCSGIDKRRPEA